MLEKVWFTHKNFVSSIMGLCLAEIRAKHKGVWIVLKKVSWASHFGNIFMKSSLMADILNKSNFYLTFSFYLSIQWLLFVCLMNWIGSLIHHNMPDHSISPFPHENNLCVKKNNLEFLLQFWRLLDYWRSGLLSMALSAIFQVIITRGYFLPSLLGTR